MIASESIDWDIENLSIPKYQSHWVLINDKTGKKMKDKLF